MRVHDVYYHDQSGLLRACSLGQMKGGSAWKALQPGLEGLRIINGLINVKFRHCPSYRSSHDTKLSHCTARKAFRCFRCFRCQHCSHAFAVEASSAAFLREAGCREKSILAALPDVETPDPTSSYALHRSILILWE